MTVSKSSKPVKTLSFVLFEIILYVSFLYFDVFDSQRYEISAILKFIGIVGCFIYVMLLREQKVNSLTLNLVRGALFFTVISDVFLLLTNESEKGVFTFCIVQGIYRYYLYMINGQHNKKQRDWKFLYLPNIFLGGIILATMHLVNISVNILIVITVFYFVSILINVVIAIKLACKIKDKFISIFAMGMVLFLCCDINVGIFNLSDFLDITSNTFSILYQFSTIGMWLFYLPAQVLIAISISLKNDKNLYEEII